MTNVVSLGTNSATRGPGDRSGSWRSWSKPYERPIDRPAPTVDTKALTAWAVHRPGERDATLTTTAYRPTVDDLAVLQGFPRGYPWRGTRMEQGRQVGDAVPPPLATAILAAVRKDASVLIEDVEAVDLCAGPGGWDTGARMLDPEFHARIVGIEWDDAACLTREAAGHRTLKGDIAEVIPLTFRGAKGIIASPPCTLFSQAGSGVGRDLLDLLADAIWRILHGDDCRMEVRQLVYPTCHAAQLARNERRIAKGKPSWTPDQISEAARTDAYIACLVLEPARYIFDLSESLEWLAFEQVPAVLPLWRIYQTALRKMGWSVWTGILNAADYGVPQTRTRAILIGRRSGAAGPPAATHAEFPADDLFGGAVPKWVSMADALGWGAARVGFGRQDDRGDSPDGLRERDFRGQDEPALTLTEKSRSWVRQPVELVPGSFADGRGNGNRRTYDADETAPTLHFGNDSAGWRWRDVSGNDQDDELDADVSGNPEANPQVSGTVELPETSGYVVNTGRDWQERGSGRAAAQTRPIESPAPTVDTGGRWWIERLHDQTGTPVDLDWPTERPATTISSRDRVTHPGANANRFNESTKSRNDGLRVTEQEAGVLQAFPADYPWQGNRTAIFRQIGDAVPPQLAAHVLASALGRTYDGGPVLATVERDVPVSGLANNSQANAARRSLDEPAGTVFFGARLNTVMWEPQETGANDAATTDPVSRGPVDPDFAGGSGGA